MRPPARWCPLGGDYLIQLKGNAAAVRVAAAHAVHGMALLFRPTTATTAAANTAR